MIAAALPAANGSAKQVQAANGKRRSRKTTDRRGSPARVEGATEGLRVAPGGETCGPEACGVGRPAHNTTRRCEAPLAGTKPQDYSTDSISSDPKRVTTTLAFLSSS